MPQVPDWRSRLAEGRAPNGISRTRVYLSGHRRAVCRVPGASNTDEFWQLLIDGRQCMCTAEQYEQQMAQRMSYSDCPRPLQHCAFLENALVRCRNLGDEVEAECIDPQQRIALELTWAALEDASIVPAEISGARIGLFVGAMRDDFAAVTTAIAPHQQSLLGSLRSVIAGRISHFFGFIGPSLVVDSGQSSSLTAVTLAMESLRREEVDIAIAGGVHLNLNANAGIALAELGLLSPDGICRPFDRQANGYVRGEGGDSLYSSDFPMRWSTTTIFIP